MAGQVDLLCLCAPADHQALEELTHHMQTAGLPFSTLRGGESLAARLPEAQAVLLLLSVDYFVHCTADLDLILQQKRERGLLVLPVLWRPLRWEDCPLSALQPLPPGGPAVTLWEDRDAAWVAVLDGLRGARAAFGAKAPKFKLVILFAPEDQAYCLALEKHLSVLARKGLVEIWHEGKTLAGDMISAPEVHVRNAHLLMTLLSADFLSDLDEHERYLAEAIEKQSRREARIIPVQTRACEWSFTLFKDLTVIPRKPVVEFRSRDRAWNEVVKAAANAVEELTIAHKEKQKRVRWKLVLTGTIDDADKSTIDAILNHIGRLSGDSQVTLEKCQAGSIVLTLISSKFTYQNIKKLYKDGRLKELHGFPVNSIRLAFSFRILLASITSVLGRWLIRWLEMLGENPPLGSLQGGAAWQYLHQQSLRSAEREQVHEGSDEYDPSSLPAADVPGRPGGSGQP